jgi:uncharacterized protein (DUF2235 family)
MTVKQVVVSPRAPRKTLIVCLDEGVADPVNGRHYLRGASNIVRLHDAILRDSDSQISIYIPGQSGSERGLSDFSVGAVDELCGEAHAALVSAWNPGDTLILVGAGRGASVCIELARQLAAHGIPDRATVWKDATGRVSYMQRNECVYKKDGSQKTHSSVAVDLLVALDPLAEVRFPKEYAPGASDGMFRLVSSTETPSSVNKLVSMLAIDDHRHFFEPLILEESNIVTEIWVPGMHEAVVGTGRERLISDIPLSLAVRTLKSHGVHFYKPALDEITDNRDGLGVLGCEEQPTAMLRRDRTIRTNQTAAGMSGSGRPQIHAAAEARMKRQADYRPASLQALNGEYMIFDPES